MADDEPTEAQEKILGEILIRITDNRITYDSEYSLAEVVFWLDTVKAMLVRRVIEDT